MKYKHGLAFPDADSYLYDRLPPGGLWQMDAYLAGLTACGAFRTAIDGGAHIGTWSLKLAERFNRVLAVEPALDTFAALQHNTAGKNIELVNAALGALAGSVSMTWRKKDAHRAHTGARYIQEGGEIPRITIDSLALDDVDFIKLDLEGGEPDALAGAVETLIQCRPVVVFEDKGFCKRFGHAEETARMLLKRIGCREIEKIGINRVWGW